ncbi:MAG: SAM hydrolase/SAM-dependent halogenase family protein [Microcoleaceae cyanobacterium]
MMHPPMITLLTDFGISDVYVGVMKGVIAEVSPELQVVDLTHQIPPQNIAAARFCLMNAVPYFPVGTIHVAVVDPGVGTRRRAIAISTPQGYLVGPDNGLFSGVVEAASEEKGPEAIEAIELTNSKYWRTAKLSTTSSMTSSATPSTTFHGRDIFASVAAHLATGIPLERFGHPIDPATLVDLSWQKSEFTEEGIEGCIQYIDQFGNLVTNIPGEDVQGKTWFVAISDLNGEATKEKDGKDKKKKKEKSKKDKSLNEAQIETEVVAMVSRIIPSGKTYSDVQVGQLVAFVGSHGWVEIAANQGNAKTQLMLGWGERVQVLLCESSENLARISLEFRE